MNFYEEVFAQAVCDWQAYGYRMLDAVAGAGVTCAKDVDDLHAAVVETTAIPFSARLSSLSCFFGINILESFETHFSCHTSLLNCAILADQWSLVEWVLSLRVNTQHKYLDPNAPLRGYIVRTSNGVAAPAVDVVTYTLHACLYSGKAIAVHIVAPYLIRLGAGVDVRDSFGRSPRDLARARFPYLLATPEFRDDFRTCTAATCHGFPCTLYDCAARKVSPIASTYLAMSRRRVEWMVAAHRAVIATRPRQ